MTEAFKSNNLSENKTDVQESPDFAREENKEVEEKQVLIEVAKSGDSRGEQRVTQKL